MKNLGPVSKENLGVYNVNLGVPKENLLVSKKICCLQINSGGLQQNLGSQ